MKSIFDLIKKNRSLLFLTGLALTIRIIFLLIIKNDNAAEVWDAYGYYYRASMLHEYFHRVLNGTPISYQDLLVVYRAHWPPLQSVILALGLIVFGNNLIVGQIMMVVISGLTTILVYAVSEKMSGQKAAFFAALIFAIYPSFIHISLRLLSENPFFFVSLLILYLCLVLEEQALQRKKFLLATVIGVFLGAAVLIRASALVYVPIIGLWAAMRSKSNLQRFFLPLAIWISFAVIILPWEYVLYKVEGRLVMITTSSEENLYRGNNPYIPTGYGSYGLTRQMIEPVHAYMDQHRVSDKEAMRALAIQEIVSNPAQFLIRGVYKIRDVWSPDSDIFTYILTVIYPPANSVIIGAVLIITLLGLPLVILFIIFGFFVSDPKLNHRDLVLALFSISLLMYFVTMGDASRFHVSLLIILLPAFGHGYVHRRQFIDKFELPRKLLLISTFLLFCVFYISGIRIKGNCILDSFPSSYYKSTVQTIAKILANSTLPVSDRVLFRTVEPGPRDITFVLSNNEYELQHVDTGEFTWHPDFEAGLVNLVISSQDPHSDIHIQVSTPQSSIDLYPVTSAAWHRWIPTGIPGLEYMWVGSALFPAKSNLGREVAKKPDCWDQLIIPCYDDLYWTFKTCD